MIVEFTVFEVCQWEVSKLRKCKKYVIYILGFEFDPKLIQGEVENSGKSITIVRNNWFFLFQKSDFYDHNKKKYFC